MKRSEKNEIKHIEEQTQIIKQSMDLQLVEEMKKESDFYKNKILENLNLENKNRMVYIDNFERNINKLGIDIASIDPKLKRLSKIKINSDLIMKKIQDRVHIDEMEKKEKFQTRIKQSNDNLNNININKTKNFDFIKKNEIKSVMTSSNNFNKNLGLNNTSDVSVDTSGNINNFSHFEKRLGYENYRNIINRDFLKEKKRRLHEMKMKEMFIGNDSKKKYNEKDIIEKFDSDIFFKDLLKENLKQRRKDLSNKIRKRQSNNVNMRKLANYLIDFVEEIFEYEKEKNTEEIKIEDWRNWTSMFIKNEPYSVSLKSSIIYFDEDNSFDNKNDNDKNEKIDEVNNNLVNKNIHKNKFFETIEIETNYSDRIFEDCDLLDYTFFRGKFQKEIIPKESLNKMLDIFDIMGPELEKTSNSNKFKTSNYNNNNNNNEDYGEYEPKDEDIENLTIPDTYQKNYIFTDIIDIILDLKLTGQQLSLPGIKSIDSINSYSNNLNMCSNESNNDNINETNISNMNNNNNNNNNTIPAYEANNNQNKKNYSLNHIPIKIALIGKSFSGKKTQAKLISENYPIKIYAVEEIIKKNQEILDNLKIPVEQNPKYKNLKKNELDKIIADRQIEEQKFEHIKSSVINLKNVLESKEFSQSKKDEAIIEFVINMVRSDFPEKTTPQQIEEIMVKNKRKKEINEEISKIKETEKNNAKGGKTTIKSQSQYVQDLHKLNVESSKGFILTDFPKTFSQATILEQKLSGFVFELDKPKNDLENLRDIYTNILDKIVKPPKKKILFQSGLDICFYLEADSSECLRRSQNRKLDTATNYIYHMDDNPPNIEDKKLLERLIGTEEIQPPDDLIVESHNIFDRNINKILEFYNIFGNTKANFKMLNKIPIYNKTDDNKKDYRDQVNSIFNEINQVINHVIKINEEKENEFLAQQLNLKKENEYHFGNNPMSGTINTNSNLGIGTISNNNNYLINPANIIHSVSDSVDNSSKDIDNHSKMHSIDNENKNMNNSIDVISSLQVQNLDEDDFNKYHRKLLEAKNKIGSSIIEEIFNKWQKTHETYNTSLKQILRSFKKQKDSIIVNYTKLQEKFIEFLKRTSKKNIEIQKFQSKFNHFLEEYPVLKSDNQVKSIFKQDLADLGDRVWEIIDHRKEEAIGEMEKIMSGGWIEKEMEKFYGNIEKLFVSEVEKLINSLIIIRQFYSNMDGRIFTDILSLKPSDILKEDDLGSIPLEKEVLKKDKKDINSDKTDNDNNSRYIFPRIDKIYNNAIKIILKFDITLKNQEKLIKNSTTNNSLDISTKKATLFLKGLSTKKQLIDSTFIDDKREIFIYEEEMKKAIKIEKNKYKYRITFLKHWAINILNNMKRITKMIFTNLDEWIVNSIKAENDAMNNLIFYLDNHIESETKVKCEMEMDCFDIFKIVNIEEIFDSDISIRVRLLLDIKFN